MIQALPLPFRRKAAAVATPELQLARMRKDLRRLLRLVKAASCGPIALQKFQTTGASAVPMTLDETCVVLGRTKAAIHTQVSLKNLRRRYKGKAGFHPDDVRAFIENDRKQ